MVSKFSRNAVGAFCTGVAVSVQEVDALLPDNRTSHQFLQTLDDFLKNKVVLSHRDRKELDKILEALHLAMETALVVPPGGRELQ